MAIFIRKISLSFFSLLILGGCTKPLTPDFTEMSANYANILEQYQINSILINVVRASNDRPLSFLDIPSINGSGNVSNAPSISGSMNGFVGGFAGGLAGITSLSPSLSLTFGNSFNFSQSSLDNSTFLRGFLSQIPIETAKFFISDNLPRELMFSLLISSIEIKNPNGKSTKYINNPLLPDYPAFQAELYKLLSYGLTIDQIEKEPKNSNPLPMPSNPDPPYGHFSRFNEFGGNNNFLNFGNPFLASHNQIQYKICVDENKFSNFVKEEFSPNIFCKSNQLSPDKKSIKSELILMMRSTNNVFEYLGQVVTAQNSSKPFMVTLPPTDSTYKRKEGQDNQYALLVVKKNDGSGKNFASVKSLDGDIYSIPSENNGYSSLVIKIISSLLSLNKIPGSIPTSPGILLR